MIFQMPEFSSYDFPLNGKDEKVFISQSFQKHHKDPWKIDFFAYKSLYLQSQIIGSLQWYRRMLINSKLQTPQEVQTAIEDIILQYESVLTSNFEKREHKLIQELFEEAKEKKKQLAFYKKMLSQQDLERLISERRREKEKQRQSLQSRWRECNESYKKLQQEQKRLINEHKENLFDATKLQEKIAQFKVYHTKLQQRVENLQNEKEIKFLTEAREGYQSPYKRDQSMKLKQTISSQKMQKLNSTQISGKFFSDKYSLDKELILKERHLKSTDILNLFGKTSNEIKKSKIKTLNSNYAIKYPQKYKKKQEKEHYKEELFKFLLSPKIKQKIFEILNREL